MSTTLVLTPALVSRSQSAAASKRSLVGLDLEADADGDAIRLDLHCTFQAFHLRARGRDGAASYYLGAAGGVVQIALDGGGTFSEYTRSMELPRHYRTEDRRQQTSRMVIAAGSPEAGVPETPLWARDAGESISMASDIVSRERLLTSDVEEGVLSWKLLYSQGTLTAMDFATGTLCLSAVLEWPAGKPRTGTIRFLPDVMNMCTAGGAPIGALKSALIRYCLEREGIAIDTRRGIEMHFEVRSL